MPDAPSSLGALLKALREGRGLTVPDVVARLKVPKSTAYWWEGPQSRPPPEDLKRLLDLYEPSDADRLLAWELRGTPALSSSASEPAPAP